MTEQETHKARFEEGKKLFEAGDLQAAGQIFIPLVEDAPDDLTARQYLTQIYSTFGYYPEAVETFRPNFEGLPEGPEKYGYFGNLCFMAGLTDEALQHLGKAESLTPGNPEIPSAMALCYVQTGEMEKAGVKIREALKINPDHTRSLVILADIDPAALDAENIARLATVVADQNQHPGNRIDVAFALGKAHLKTEKYEEAFNFFQNGNAFLAALFKSQGISYSTDAEEARFNSITSFYTKEYLGHIPLGVPSMISPIFIIGLPRSGTTLVEQIISSHSKVHGGGEYKLLSEFYMGLEELSANSPETPKTDLIGQVTDAWGAEYFGKIGLPEGDGITHTTDKMPQNFQFVGLASKLFPTAKFIFIHRNPLDTCLSMFFQPLANSYPAATSLDDLGDYYKLFERYLSYWAEAMPGKVLEVSYEDLVADQEGVSKKLISFSGLQWEDACLEFHKNPRPVHTMSNVQVRQPMTEENVGRWKHFEQQLQPLKTALEGAGSDE